MPEEDDDDQWRYITIKVNQNLSFGFDWTEFIGMCIAFYLSYTKWKLVGWAIVAALFGWLYVLYYIFMFAL